MSVVDIPFPRTSQPGSQPGEGLGRLLNVYFEADGDIALWRRVPGLIPFADTLLPVPRGMIDVDGTLYDARENAAVTVSTSGIVTPLTGTLNGSDLVTWEHNNREPTHDLVAVCGAGTFSVSSTAVTPYPALAVPAAFNSVDFLDGYLLFTTADGRIFASGINDIWVDDTDHTQNSLAFTTADQAGVLVRGTVWAEQYFAWGSKATTVYQNAATAPFPLSRLTIIPVGLASASAICGFEPGWSLTQYFVATDNTVQKMNGTNPETVSNKDVERAITAQVDKDQIEMFCYVIGGRPTVVVQGPNFTWELNAVTGFWNERQSPNLAHWRASHSVYFDKKWLVGDTLTGESGEVIWTTSATVQDWTGVAMSLDGLIIAACEQDSVGSNQGHIWLSTDGGGTFTAKVGAGNRNWRSVAMSSDGSVIAATWQDDSLSPTTGIVVSTNGGTTWTNHTIIGAQFLITCSVSGDGLLILTAEANVTGIGGGNIYLSTNSGSSFSTTTADPQSWNQVVVSRDGSTMGAVSLFHPTLSDGQILISTDVGVTWNTVTPVGFRWETIALSANGTIGYASYGVGIWKSIDSGSTWTALPSASTFPVLSLIVSDDGQTVFVMTDNNNLLTISDDGGTTWEAQNLPGALNWFWPAISANGSSLAAVVFGGQIWVGDYVNVQSAVGTGSQILQLTSSVFSEAGTSYMQRLESGPVKQFAARIRCKEAFFDWTTGQGTIGGTEDSMHPEIAISTSLDGGGTWSTPVIRRTLGGLGDYQRMIRVNRIGGISTQHGIRFRLDVSSPVYETFRGGRCDVDLLEPP